MMPLMNHRSSTRGTPLGLFGSSGCRRANWASDSQKWWLGMANSQHLGGANYIAGELQSCLWVLSLGPAKTYVVASDLSAYHPAASIYGDHTTGSGNMLGVNGAADGSAFWQQTVSVAAGASYTFSMFTSNWNGGLAELQLFINGALVGATFTPSSTGLWVESVFVTRASGAATTATLALVDLNALNSLDFAVDDLSFAAAQVPVPAALPLMLGGLGVLAFARRKRAA
ncbi:MAG: hypothetical protein ACJAVS_001724 [Paracoccaceae bacterium]|jgi:hypothetical protein